LHYAPQPAQFVIGEKAGAFHFGKELQARYGILGQLSIFNGQHEYMTEKGKMPIDCRIAPEAFCRKTSMPRFDFHTHLIAWICRNPSLDMSVIKRLPSNKDQRRP
jgi:hypothetical protein